MEAAWIGLEEDGGGKALLFPLHKSKHLMLDGIAAHWGLDPCTLRAADLALLKDAEGNSVMSLDQITSLLSSQPSHSQLGDGLSQQTPLVITGKRRRDSLFEASDTFHETKVGKALAEVEARKQELDRRRRMNAAKSYAMKEELYQHKRVHKYVLKLMGNSPPTVANAPLLQEKVGSMIGAVHLVSRQSSQPPSIESRTGMATLIRPNGTCWTALGCVAPASNSSKGADDAIMVKFRDAPWFECKISATYNDSVACLEPVDGSLNLSFDTCMCAEKWRCELKYLVTVSSYSVWPDLIMGVVVGEGVMMPCSTVTERGAPVFLSCGYLAGVVVAPQLGRYHKGGVRTSKGREVELAPIAKVLEELGKSKYKSYLEGETDMIMVLKSRQQMLVEFAPISWKLPEQEWKDNHPLEEFAEAAKSVKGRPLIPGKAPRGKLRTREESKAIKERKELEARQVLAARKQMVRTVYGGDE
ncbi:hypothetical protein SELMODRAFT_417858 [Selaginella moellendorffii]|uniref:Uncharacterized protein n=1 Tax=Selaginella moellendorffii TaxID=88036 RepID=D8S3V7_SELML|nr:hypothetical protein SELMODRAFT_417858 [Selaginella moellendorffii]